MSYPNISTLDQLKESVNNGFDVHEPMEYLHDHGTYLHYAVGRGHSIDMLGYLLNECGCDVLKIDGHRDTSLVCMMSIKGYSNIEEFSELFELFLSKLTLPVHEEYGNLMLMETFRHPERMEMLIMERKRGRVLFDVNYENSQGKNVLHRMLKCNTYTKECLDALCECGLDLESTFVEEFGIKYRALTYAGYFGMSDAFMDMVEKGADMRKPDGRGVYPFAYLAILASERCSEVYRQEMMESIRLGEYGYERLVFLYFTMYISERYMVTFEVFAERLNEYIEHMTDDEILACEDGVIHVLVERMRYKGINDERLTFYPVLQKLFVRGRNASMECALKDERKSLECVLFPRDQVVNLLCLLSMGVQPTETILEDIIRSRSTSLRTILYPPAWCSERCAISVRETYGNEYLTYVMLCTNLVQSRWYKYLGVDLMTLLLRCLECSRESSWVGV